MHPFLILLALFFIVPIVEVYLLIQVGSIIGALSTTFLVVFTAVLGAWLLRIQGFSTLRRIQGTLAQGGLPAVEILGGALLLVSGALLLTPGFFTDAIGFMCLVPSFRHVIVRWALSRFFKPMMGGVAGFSNGQQSTQTDVNGHNTIEGEYRKDDN